MNTNNHIKELEKAIENIKKEPVKGWMRKIGKSWKISKIQQKIDSLKKQKNK
jgi:hypothetical protein